MGREVRRVPPNWKHPKRYRFRRHGWREEYVPLLSGPYHEARAEWLRDLDEYRSGFAPYTDGRDWLDFVSPPPHPEEYMPDWPKQVCTHYQMYETTSEGTPISPVMETPEELAQWLADNGASAFAGMTADYESWLRVARGGYAPSAVVSPGGVRSGVEGVA